VSRSPNVPRSWKTRELEAWQFPWRNNCYLDGEGPHLRRPPPHWQPNLIAAEPHSGPKFNLSQLSIEIPLFRPKVTDTTNNVVVGDESRPRNSPISKLNPDG